MRPPSTINIKTSDKLKDKSKQDIMRELVDVFENQVVLAVQVGYKVVRVAFKTIDQYEQSQARVFWPPMPLPFSLLPCLSSNVNSV